MIFSYLAFINVGGTDEICESWQTQTSEAVDSVLARGIILTRVTFAFIDVDFASLAFVTWSAFAFVLIHLIMASGSVHARLVKTLVKVQGAVVS